MILIDINNIEVVKDIGTNRLLIDVSIKDDVNTSDDQDKMIYITDIYLVRAEVYLKYRGSFDYTSKDKYFYHYKCEKERVDLNIDQNEVLVNIDFTTEPVIVYIKLTEDIQRSCSDSLITYLVYYKPIIARKQLEILNKAIRGYTPCEPCSCHNDYVPYYLLFKHMESAIDNCMYIDALKDYYKLIGSTTSTTNKCSCGK